MIDLNLKQAHDGKVVVKTNPTFDRMIESLDDPKAEFMLRGLAATVRLVSREIFQDVSSCIGTSRLMMMVLDRFGEKSEILSVTTEIWNSKLIKLVNSLIRTGKVKDLRGFVEWQQQNMKEYLNSGAHLITIGEPGPDNVNVGHYCVYLPERNIVLDATLDQANRPNKMVEIDTMIGAFLPAEFKNGKRLVIDAHKCHIVYHHSTNQNYLKSGDWLRDPRHYGTLADDIYGFIVTSAKLFLK